MTIGVGLIGFGLAGKAFHAPLIMAERRMTLAAVASSRPADVSAALPAVRIHPDAQALIADPAVELVVIATPNDLHAPLARTALAAGKHVVIDKPFVTRVLDGEDLVALAAAQDRILGVFHNRRWDGDFLTVARLLREDVLGDILLAEMCWDRFRPAIKPGWREAGGDGSGLLADLGPHLIDQILQLFGPPQTIAADIGVQRDDAMVDDWWALTLGYGRCRVHLSASSVITAPRPRFALHGTRGSFVKYGIDPQEAVLRAGGSPDADGFGVDLPQDYALLTLADAAAVPVPSERGDWRAFYAGIAAAILDGAPVPVEPGDALAGLRLIDLARRSAAEGRTIAV